MKKVITILLICGCTSKNQIRGVAEVLPVGDAPGEVRYLNLQEVKESRKDSNLQALPKGGWIKYKFAEYVLSESDTYTISVVANIFGDGSRKETSCIDYSTFTPEEIGNGSVSKFDSKKTGLKRIEVECDILEEVGHEFLFVVKTDSLEKSFRIKTNLKKR